MYRNHEAVSTALIVKVVAAVPVLEITLTSTFSKSGFNEAVPAYEIVIVSVPPAPSTASISWKDAAVEKSNESLPSPPVKLLTPVVPVNEALKLQLNLYYQLGYNIT